MMSNFSQNENNKIDLNAIVNTKSISELRSLIWQTLLLPIDETLDNEATTLFRAITGVKPTQKNVKLFFEKVQEQAEKLSANSDYFKKPYNLRLYRRSGPYEDEEYYQIAAISSFYLKQFDKAAYYAGKLSEQYSQLHSYYTDHFAAEFSELAIVATRKLQENANTFMQHNRDAMSTAGAKSFMFSSGGFARIANSEDAENVSTPTAKI